MTNATHESGPRLYRVGGTEIDTAIAGPSITLIEIGDEFGFLLADSAESVEKGGGLRLTSATWAKSAFRYAVMSSATSIPRDLHVRPLASVRLYRHQLGPFVAEDEGSGLYLPQPSNDPYIVVFITTEQYAEIQSELAVESVRSILPSLRAVLEDVPGISVERQSILGPGSYAHGVRVEFDQPLMTP